MQSELREIAIALLDDHPDNPRLVYREDVIDAVASVLKGTAFPQKHAVHVRPVGDRFHLIAGLQRKRAAIKAGLKKVWAWVEDLDDEAAYMELATSNNQGELSPLEIGLHALKAVPLEKGGRGKKGGLSEYAEKIGKTKQHVSETREAAEVYLTVKASTQVDGFLDKCKHLAAIHKADRSCWPILADLLVAKGWNVQATEAAVDQAKQAEAILPKNWFRVHYVPLSEVVMAVAGGARQLKAFERLLAKVAEIQEYAEKHRGKSAVKAFLDWLAENKGGKSWDMGELQNYLLDLQEVEAPAGKYDVIVADPPWKYDFAETESRQVENQYPTMTPEELAALEVPSADNCVLFMWATAPKLREALTLLEAWGFQYKTHAVWNKEKIGMGYWFRGQHELLLVATKGEVSPPPPAARPASVFSDARKGHSRKPECAYATIEAMFPTANRCEMFARGSRSGWTSWGNEATKKQEKR